MSCCTTFWRTGLTRTKWWRWQKFLRRFLQNETFFFYFFNWWTCKTTLRFSIEHLCLQCDFDFWLCDVTEHGCTHLYGWQQNTEHSPALWHHSTVCHFFLDKYQTIRLLLGQSKLDLLWWPQWDSLLINYNVHRVKHFTYTIIDTWPQDILRKCRCRRIRKEKGGVTCYCSVAV